MLNFIRILLSDSKPLILGFGREGKSTYNLIRKALPDIRITIADVNPSTGDFFTGKDENISLITGKDYLDNIGEYLPVFRSPGIPLMAIDESLYKRLTSQTSLFLSQYSGNITGVTGTKGKSTTASLIAHIHKLYNSNSLLAGNIGIPLFDMVNEIDENTNVICELSSHQLQDIQEGPHIAVLLNVFQEHLDYYNSYEEYQEAKFNIIKKQNERDFCIYNSDDPVINKLFDKYSPVSARYCFSLNGEVERGCFMKGDVICFRDNGKDEIVYTDGENSRNLLGRHNLQNIMAAIIACRLKDIPQDIINQGIKTMNGLSHRMEYLGNYGGVDFYDDSIATIPEATIAAVKAIPDVYSLILGGYDRGIDYKELALFLAGSDVKVMFFIDKAGQRIMNELQRLDVSEKLFYKVNTLEEAVLKAKNETLPGKACLLSPAAASYGMFKNFEERGMKFRDFILSL